MKKNITEVVAAIRLVAIFIFTIIFGACTDEHYVEPQKNDPNPPVIKGDTTIVFDDAFKFNHESWEYSNGLAKADNFYDGYVNYLVDGNVVKSDLIDHQIAPMELVWTPMEETTSSSAEKMYIGQKAGDAKTVETGKNQAVTLAKNERECKLSFVGAELTIKGSWWLASLGKDIRGCQYDSTTVVTQIQDTAKVNGSKIEVIVDGNKYNRVNVTAKALNHFTDLPAKTVHKEEMNILYSTLVPVIFIPGDKIYNGSAAIDGTGSYVKVSNESYKSTIKLTHYFTQDGNTLKEEETVSGIASVKTWVEEKGQKMIVPTIEIGNPTFSVEETISELYPKEGFIYAKKYITVWTYKWVNGFTKKVHSEVERLYYRREEGKEVAMPYGETSTSFKNFIAGNSVEKSENNQKYNTYPEGVVYFNGEHKSETGNLKDAISGLSVGQEFWVKKEEPKDEFIDFTVEIIPAEKNNGTSQIIITENWTISGKKTLTYSQAINYTFEVSDLQRVFGESLNFHSGLTKSVNDPAYTPVNDVQYVRNVTTTYTAKFDLCDVKGFAGMTDGYVLYRSKKYFFEAQAAEVTYGGLNKPTVTEVEEGVNKYSRKAYEVTLNHSVKGNKIAKVNVDKLLPQTPDMPDEMGPVDITKTKNFGRLSWAWDASGKEFISGTIVTAYGVVSFWNGGYCFNKMATAEIKDKLGNSLYPENSENYVIPSYITIESKPNKHWIYTDVNGKARDEIYGTLIEKLEDVSLNEPFFGTPSETSETYQIIDQDGSTRIRVVYKGTVLFDHVFSK